jgi:SAM-dependent methyltransferase
MSSTDLGTRRACVSRTAAAARTLCGQAGWVPGETALLVESGVEQLGGGAADRARSAYMPDGLDAFDSVQMDHTFQLMPCEWSRALLRRLLERTAPAGTVRIPLRAIPGSRKPRDAAEGWIGSLFHGHAAVEAERDALVVTRGSGPGMGRAASTLEWFMDRWKPALDIAVDGRMAESPGLDPRDERIKQASALGYYIGGLSYKAPLLAHIARDLGLRGQLRTVDMGAGYGLLAAELLLDPGLGVELATATDISPLNESLAALLREGLGEASGKFRFARCPAQDHRFDEQVDLVSYVGSLLYVPREQLRTCLDRAWEALRPGGILVVHENIRDPKYVRDFKYMFTVEEIDAELGRYGEIRRFASNRECELSRDDAGAKTVFRVLRRPRS